MEKYSYKKITEQLQAMTSDDLLAFIKKTDIDYCKLNEGISADNHSPESELARQKYNLAIKEYYHRKYNGVIN